MLLLFYIALYVLVQLPGSERRVSNHQLNPSVNLYLSSHHVLFPGPLVPRGLGFESNSVDLGLLSLRNVVTSLADPRRNARYGPSKVLILVLP